MYDVKSIPKDFNNVKKEGEKRADPVNSVQNQIESSFFCSHPETEIRYKVLSNGGRQYREQCLHCGRSISEAIAYRKVPNIESIQEHDHQREAAYQARIEAARADLWAEAQELWELRQTDWDLQYQQYIKTPRWREKRDRVLERDHYLCQACLRRRAAQAHHLTYKHAKRPLEGNEPLFDLVAVCQTCHDKLTELDGREVNRE
jgi:5-methylcytosine-specific restriction endonuclease McrA